MYENDAVKKQLMQLQTEEEIDKYFQDQAHFVMAKRKIETIDNFNGVFDFLNNEFPCEVYYEGRLYPSAFHAFQAARSEEDQVRAKMSHAESMQELYELATEVEDPQDWQNRRVGVMEKCIRDKFRRHRELKKKLQKTGNRDLVNTYADRTSSNLFWGCVDGKGENHLGNILMKVRADLHEEKDLQKWLSMILDPQEDKFLLPTIKVHMKKGDQKLGTEVLKKQSSNIFGLQNTCDVVLGHQSISRSHCCIFTDKQMGVVLIDLGSKGGTYLNGQSIAQHIPVPLKSGDWFSLGESTRRFEVEVDFRDVQEYLDKKQKNLQMDLKILSLQKSMDQGADVVKYNLGLYKQDTIFVSGIADSTSEQQMKEAFAQFGTIEHIRMPISRHSGNHKGICFIKYQNESAAKNAFNTCRLMVNGRLVKIQFAERNKEKVIEEMEKAVVQKSNRDRRDSPRRARKDSRDYNRDRSRYRRDSRDRPRDKKYRGSSRERSRDRTRRHHKRRQRSQSRSDDYSSDLSD